MIATLFLIGLMLVASGTDILQQKIYNWTTYSGMLIALSLSAVATALDRSELSSIGIGTSLLGLLSCGGVMLVCFLLFRIGGGDVKLIAMGGAFLGPEFGIQMLLWTFVLGAASAMIFLIWKIGFAKLARRLWQQAMYKLAIGRWEPLTNSEKDQLQTPLYLAPSALLAVLIVHFSLVERFVE